METKKPVEVSHQDGLFPRDLPVSLGVYSLAVNSLWPTD